MAKKPVDSPLLRSGVFTAMGMNEYGSTVDRKVVRAHEAIVRARQEVMDAAEAIQGDTMRTPAARKSVIADMAYKRLSQATRKYDEARHALREERAELEKLESAPVPPGDPHDPVGPEIRAHLKNLSDDERHKAINDAMAKGNDRLLQAMFNAPGFLSGLGDAHASMLQDEAMRVRYPQEKKRLELLRKVEQQYDALGQVAVDWHSSFADDSEMKAAEAAHSKAQKALSQAITEPADEPEEGDDDGDA